MRTSTKMWVVGIAVILLVLGATVAVGANSILPDGVVEWTRSDGSVCSAVVSEYGVALDCDCPCDELCVEPTVTPKVVHTSTPKTQEPTSTPEPTKKVKCNSGRGNGSEGDPDCDPGNSGGHNEGGD